jgi:hypothetical protein
MYQQSSGAKKRKVKAEEEKRHEAVLDKTRKLSEFFPSSSAVAESETAGPEAYTDSEVVVSLSPAPPEAELAVTANEPSDPTTIEASDGQVATLTGVINEFPLDLGLWPDQISDEMRDYWVEKGSASCQNRDSSFSETRKTYSAGKSVKSRGCSKSLFSYIHEPTQQKIQRTWVCYSHSSKALYCFHCKLFCPENSSPFVSGGICDWKNAAARLKTHEQSTAHRESVLKLLDLAKEKSRIDAGLVAQYKFERQYWISILERIVEVIRFVAERGLAFRGHDEKLGSKSNGNYLGLLELLAKFDPFLSAHIEKQKALQDEGEGRRTVSYLSSTICEEFIAIMADRVLNTIVSEVKDAKYFAVSIDSTADACNVDRLTCILRYVPKDGDGAVERFTQFLGMESHKAKDLASRLLDFLDSKDIDVSNCRGQSYDNASNMAGKYSGVQAIIREKCPEATYIPCFAHSLNLAGNEAAGCTGRSTAFFDLVQHVYTFFSASTHRWTILKEHLQARGLLVVKALTPTRWSMRGDAVKALVGGYTEIRQALCTIADDEDEVDKTKNEAEGMICKMDELENAILCEVWAPILERFNATSTSLQSSTLDLNSAVPLLKSLKDYVASLRDQFDQLELKAINKSESNDYKAVSARKKKRSVRRTRVDGSAEETSLSPRESFRTQVFLPIIDSLLQALTHRIHVYEPIAELFGFLHNILALSRVSLCESAENLVKAYPKDLEPSLQDELIQFTSFAKNHVTQPAVKPNSFELELFRLVTKSGVRELFPNVDIMLRIYLTLMVTNASGERSFSTMSRVKSHIRTSMSADRLSSLSLLCIESEIMRSIDFGDIIKDFAVKKARKAPLK